MNDYRSTEIARFILFMLASVILGIVSDQLAVAIIIGLSFYLAGHIYWLLRMVEWLTHDRRAIPPEATGIWGEAFYQLYRHYQKNRRRRQRIARLLRAFRDSTSAMTEGVVVMNRDWQILWFNNAAAELLGLSAPRDIGQRVANLIRNPAFISYLGKVKGDETLEMPSPKNAALQISLHLTSYGDGEHLLLIRNITRMHRLEKMRREFIANASHELRSPLTVVSGYLEILEDDTERNPAWREQVVEMRRQSNRMLGIINDLMELSRLETAPEHANGNLVDVPAMLARLREDALALRVGPRDVSLQVDMSLQLRGEEKEIYAAFSNLVFNAMRYTQDDGHVAIRWFANAKGEPSLEVEDNGVGIAPEHIPRLTERFYRVDPGRDRARGGTGLGLAIVKHALQRHNARLEIQSALGEGSVFRCVFPAYRLVSLQSAGSPA